MRVPVQTSGTVGVVRRRKASVTRDEPSARWWRLEENKRSSGAHMVVDRIWKQQLWRRQSWIRYMRLYNNASLGGFGGRAMDPSMRVSGPRLSLNVVKSCSDAFTAKMTLERPMCKFQTSGGDWELQEQAKDAERFVGGQMYEMHLYDKLPRVVLDACVVGTGAIKTFVDGEKETARVACENTPVWELGVDEQDGQYGTPSCLYQRKMVNKLVLMEMFPAARTEIDAYQLAQSEDPAPMFTDTVSEMVPVYMMWHLRSSRAAEDGAYYIGLPNKELGFARWDYDYFPFAFYRRMPALVGFWGIGLGEELLGIQQDINGMLLKAQRHMQLMGNGHWFVERNSKVSASQLTDQIDIIRYSGVRPEVVFPAQIMSGDFWQHLERQYQRAFEITGISQLQAQSQKPAGLNSGKALDSFADIASERFSVASHNYQELVLAIGEQIIDRAREITRDDNPKYSVLSVSKNAAQRVEFLKVDLEKNEAVLQIYPTNKLSKDPAERMNQVEKLVNSGMIPPDDAPRLLEFPDLEQEWNLKYASYSLTMKIVSDILNKGKITQPRPFMNLSEAIKWAQLQELWGEVRGCKEENLQMLREWIRSADAMRSGAEAPPAGPPTGLSPGPEPPPGPPDGAMNMGMAGAPPAQA